MTWFVPCSTFFVRANTYLILTAGLTLKPLENCKIIANYECKQFQSYFLSVITVMNIADKKCFETKVFILVVDSIQRQFQIGQSAKTAKN